MSRSVYSFQYPNIDGSLFALLLNQSEIRRLIYLLDDNIAMSEDASKEILIRCCDTSDSQYKSKLSHIAYLKQLRVRLRDMYAHHLQHLDPDFVLSEKLAF